MVEEYRQALLIRKLDQHYVDRSIDTTFTDERDRGLLQRPQGRFPARPYVGQRADRAVRRRVPPGAQICGTLMGTKSEAAAAGFPGHLREERLSRWTDFRDQWVDFPEFLELPADAAVAELRPGAGDSTAVQEMRDSHAHYYFQIDAVLPRRASRSRSNGCGGRSAASCSTSARARSSAAHEEELCARAAREAASVKIFADEKPKKDE